MANFSSEQIHSLDKIYRINLINSCSGYKSANLIATQSTDGQPNVAVFSSVTHLGSNPPFLGFILRPTTVPRHTFKNIKETKFYTINHIHKSIIKDAHHTSAKYPENISEFDVTNLEMEYKDNFHAPFVKNCAVQMAMEYVEEYYIKANNTLLVVGKMNHLYVDDAILNEDGFINLAKAETATINGLDAYAVPESNLRLMYQRPKENLATE